MLYYITQPVLRNALAFLVLPIITRYLSPKDFGTIALITMVTSFGGIFCLGLNNAIYRLYFKYKTNTDRLKEMLSTNIISIVIILILYCGLIIAMFPFLNKFFFNGQLKIIWMILAFIQFSLGFINLTNQYIFQNNYEGKKWFSNEASATFVTVFLSVILVLTHRFRFEAIIISGLCGELVKGIMIFIQLRRYYGMIFRVKFLKEALSYSWPHTPTALFSFGYSYLDKILLSKFKGLSQVGILDLSSRISLNLKMAMEGMGGVIHPITLELLGENTEGAFKKIADISLKFVFLTLFLGLSLILFSKEAIVLFTTKEYHFAVFVVPIYIYYYIFSVLGYISYWLIYYHFQKTFWQIPLNAINLSVNTIANIILIPRYGLMGAVFAAFLSSGVANVIQLYVGMRITRISFNLYKVSLMFIVVLIETVFVYILYQFNLNTLIAICIKLVMLLLFALICLKQKIFNLQDLRDLLVIIKQGLKKPHPVPVVE
ncbi:MAG: oligosaccharide flippase family protein [Candidatus Omnitrophota bacterium]